MPVKKGTRRSIRRPAARVKSAEKRASARTRSARGAPATGVARPARASARPDRSASRWSSFDSRTILVGVVGVLIFATLITAGVPSGDRPAARTAESKITEDIGLAPATPDAAERRQTLSAMAPAPRDMPSPTPYLPSAPLVRTAALSYAPAVPPAAAVEPTPEAAAEPAPKQPESADAPAVAVTIAGCLERDADRFVLKKVSGDDAPKSRSWKSGFLRKRSSSVELIDDARTNRLAPYVGRRIETTGLLEDREMHVKSLRVQGACD